MNKRQIKKALKRMGYKNVTGHMNYREFVGPFGDYHQQYRRWCKRNKAEKM